MMSSSLFTKGTNSHTQKNVLGKSQQLNKQNIMMKIKNILLLALACLMSMSMTSCSSNDDITDDDGEIIAPNVVHNYYGVSITELKAKMAAANYSVITEESDEITFGNNGDEPSKVTFYFDTAGKMTNVVAYVSVNANNKMSHFQKWDDVMVRHMSDYKDWVGVNTDEGKIYPNHAAFVASINKDTKDAQESMSNAKNEIVLQITNNVLYYKLLTDKKDIVM